MNKYQEALNRLIGITYNFPFKEWQKNDNKEMKELLQELVDKEIPMKLTNKRPCFSEEGVIWGNCKCGNEIDYVKYLRDFNYCYNCGQKLDWTDEDE